MSCNSIMLLLFFVGLLPAMEKLESTEERLAWLCEYASSPQEHDEAIFIINSNAININWQENGTGKSFLHKLTHNKTLYITIANALLKKGINVNCTDDNQNTPLHEILHPGDSNDPKKWTAASYVAFVKLLLERGASVNALNAEKRTPLSYFCCYTSDIELVWPVVGRLLLEKGARPNGLPGERQTPLQCIFFSHAPHNPPADNAYLFPFTDLLFYWGADPFLTTETDDKIPYNSYPLLKKLYNVWCQPKRRHSW